MIYATTIGLQSAEIGRNVTQLPDGDYVFSLRNNVGRNDIDFGSAGEFNADFSFDFAVDSGNTVIDSLLYHTVEWSWPIVPSVGEYQYWLTKGGVVVATGLLMVTEAHEVEMYNRELQYGQYNA